MRWIKISNSLEIEKMMMILKTRRKARRRKDRLVNLRLTNNSDRKSRKNHRVRKRERVKGKTNKIVFYLD